MSAGAEHDGDDLAVWLLAIGQTLTYGTVFYVFAALLVTLEAETGWTKAELALGPTLSVIVAALVAPLSGRGVDRGRGGELLSLLPLLGAAGLCILALAQSYVHWIIGWVVIGVTQGGALYETCFAFLTRRLGDRAPAAILRVTLVAGFASTLTYPAGAVLGPVLGWRGALFCFAAVAAVGATSVNAWGVARLRRRAARPDRSISSPPGALTRAMRRGAFWQLAIVFALAWLNHMMLITFIMPILQDRGALPAVAVFAASCIGPSQVLGRVALMALQHRSEPLNVTRLTIIGSAVGLVALIAAGVQPLLIFAFAVLQGASIGVVSVTRPVVIAQVLGREGFGAISGMMAVPVTLAIAVAPVLGAFLIDHGGVQLLLWCVLGLTLLALPPLLLLRR